MKDQNTVKPMEPTWSAQARNVLPSSAKPMLGALGREMRVRSAMEVLPVAERRELASALDEVTRPMTARELDDALLATGLSRGDRRRLTLALKGFAILMVAPK